jgi:predicted nucleic acid-binding protein
MSAKRFIDTNIWLYAMFEPAGNAGKKHRLAARLTPLLFYLILVIYKIIGYFVYHVSQKTSRR